ncbi:methylmalonyl-CoA mutase family protein [Bacillus suaedaesalsae]|uniref:Methylmalonyl-CoA mutase small subunit n=1 Tax=Bacillus suaedaesalsae TaxID=2810349 RepID=A0ABS2DFV9_9BACI|nr:methylmalonyl-CoA mutase family protein [Bacillus suaedaesalsae]MBM6617362.1 methylmalonyl-CoA mutase small subunit [Bacillus suaedaesalsae]
MTEKLSASWLNELNETFAIPSYEEWEQVAKASLKGKPLEKLYTQTYEGITLQPIYRSEQVTNNLTLQHGNPTQTWNISQEIKVTTIEETSIAIQQALQFGQTCINIDFSNSTINKEEFYGILDSFIDTEAFVFIKGDQSILKYIHSYQEEKGLTVNGVIGFDPIAKWVKTGALQKNLTKYYEEMAETIQISSSSIKCLLVDSQPVHNGGANAVQELAYTLSVAIEYINQLTERGLSIDQIAPHFAFSFSVGSNMFMEIAKLRAARFLWSAIVNEFGGSENSQRMWIHARTSITTKTKYDPYVNMLRSTVETFAAVVGGANSVHTSTFDEAHGISTEFSERIARNVQSILKEESHLHRVVDPAGGSWYIERITTELAEKVWEMIQKVEQEGGIVSSLKNGTIQNDIQNTREQRFKKIDYRKERIVGTNMYANTKEESINRKSSKQEIEQSSENLIEPIQQVPVIRWSMKYEELRDASFMYFNKHGKMLSIQLINIGVLPKHKPRTDFIKGFFEVGGFEVKDSESFLTVDEVSAFLTSASDTVYVLCGIDETYEEIGREVVQILQTHAHSSFVYIAGRLDSQTEEDYKSLGLSDTIHANTNCYEFLYKLQKEMGGYHEEA